MSQKAMLDLAKRLDAKNKKRTQEALATVFRNSGCGAVAKEIKAGRKVTGNAAFGFRMCIHERLGPRVDTTTGKFYRQTKNGKRIEQRMAVLINKLLKSGDFKPMPKTLIPKLRKKDKAFEKRMKARKW